MKVIVSNNGIDYSDFLVITSLKALSKVVGDIDIAVITNDIDERGGTLVKTLLDIKDRVSKFVYISSDENAIEELKLFILGNGGIYIRDEYYLRSSGELNALVGSLFSLIDESRIGDVKIVRDFVDQVRGGGYDRLSGAYLSIVDNSVQNLIDGYNSSQDELIQLSSRALDILGDAYNVISEIKIKNNSLAEKLEEIKSKLSPTGVNVGRGNIPSVVFFPRVSIRRKEDVILVKEVGNCRFLLSFILGLRNYLEAIRYKRARLVVILPVGRNIEELYSGYKWVGKGGGGDGDIVFTNNPLFSVLDGLIGDGRYDIYIIVDKTIGSIEHIVDIKGKNTFYAVSGMNAIERYKLDRGRCFNSVTSIGGVLFTIPAFVNYPTSAMNRVQIYNTECSDLYEKIISNSIKL